MQASRQLEQKDHSLNTIDWQVKIRIHEYNLETPLHHMIFHVSIRGQFHA
jgi:hypothetical protein